MMSVTYKLFMLMNIMLRVFMLIKKMLSVVMLSFVTSQNHAVLLAQVLVPGKTFYPCLIFVSEFCSLPKCGAYDECPARLGSCLIRKY
jgi:hypothetical protein